MREYRCGWKTATRRRGARACARRRSPPRPRSGGGRSRRRPRRPRRSARAARSAAVPPGSCAIAATARPGRRRPAPRRSSAPAALTALCAPGTVSRPRARARRTASRSRRAAGRARRRGSPAGARAPRELRPVPDDRRGLGARQEGAEGVVEVEPRAVGGVVVELGVGEHRDLGRELQQRAVGLVGLDDDPLAAPPAGVVAGRCAARRRRRRLGSSPQPRSTCTIIAVVVVLPCVPVTAMQRLSAAIWASRSARCSSPALARPRARVVGRDRGRVHDLGSGRDVLRRVADHRLDPGRPQRLEVGRLGTVRAGHARAERDGDQGAARSSRRRRSRRSAAGGPTSPARSTRDAAGQPARTRRAWTPASAAVATEGATGQMTDNGSSLLRPPRVHPRKAGGPSARGPIDQAHRAIASP